MLITCPYCKEKIDQRSPACPHCGTSRIAPQAARGSAKTERGATIGCAILAVVVLFFILRGCANLATAPSTPEEKQKQQAIESRIILYQSACDSVKARLKAPSTARFSGLTETEFRIVPVTTEVAQTLKPLYGKHPPQGQVMMIFGWVDAENSFGAKLRTDWVAVAIKHNDTWQVDRVSVSQR